MANQEKLQTARLLEDSDYHYAQLTDSDTGKHIKWLSKDQYKDLTGSAPNTSVTHLQKFIHSLGPAEIEVNKGAKTNYTQHLALVNAKLDRILALLEAK
jgi:hypothetical protein